MTNEIKRTRVDATVTVVENQESQDQVVAELQVPDPDKETAKARLDENS